VHFFTSSRAMTFLFSDFAQIFFLGKGFNTGDKWRPTLKSHSY
jgi:hypothetical protein